MKIEVWAPIDKCYPFEISNLGRVKNSKTGKIRKRSFDKDGYVLAVIRETGIRKSISKKVHRLVAQYFILNPENKPEVNHKDGNKQNNNIGNLEWATTRENKKHAKKTGLYKSGDAFSNTKTRDGDIIAILLLIKLRKLSYKKIREQFGITAYRAIKHTFEDGSRKSVTNRFFSEDDLQNLRELVVSNRFEYNL